MSKANIDNIITLPIVGRRSLFKGAGKVAAASMMSFEAMAAEVGDRMQKDLTEAVARIRIDDKLIALCSRFDEVEIQKQAINSAYWDVGEEAPGELLWTSTMSRTTCLRKSSP